MKSVRNAEIAEQEPCMVIDVRSGKENVAFQFVRYKDLENGYSECRFRVPLQIANSIVGIEIRVRVLRTINIAIRAVEIEDYLTTNLYLTFHHLSRSTIVFHF